VPSIAASARRHGLHDAEILHAFDHPIAVEYLEDGLVMFVGPDRAGNLLEVGVADSPTGPVIVHAMRARRKYLRGME
jgi:hypothetical protein